MRKMPLIHHSVSHYSQMLVVLVMKCCESRGHIIIPSSYLIPTYLYTWHEADWLCLGRSGFRLVKMGIVIARLGT